ncbi:hypothetical protein STVIR_5569 [Streptomyces viridochromogenes Tue57]|uniref:Uncharacterized protein n=1 Tax=Streptomyces viridochromogenes Tue57 TaxID=1160705 RepID=L8P7B7_STRVR|nr:hypothetical protein STVIR_5569 [Streptomyces viridochromogenes Tue57]
MLGYSHARNVHGVRKSSPQATGRGPRHGRLRNRLP